MNKLALALLLALAVAGGWLLFTCVPFVQEKATWTLTTISNLVMPTYKNLQANPAFTPLFAVGTAITGTIIGKVVTNTGRTAEQDQAKMQISGLTNNLIQTSGQASSLQSTNDSLLQQLDAVKAENTALKANDPTNHYQNLLDQADKEIVRLRDNVSNLNTQIAQMKIAVKTVVA